MNYSLQAIFCEYSVCYIVVFRSCQIAPVTVSSVVNSMLSIYIVVPWCGLLGLLNEIANKIVDRHS